MNAPEEGSTDFDGDYFGDNKKRTIKLRLEKDCLCIVRRLELNPSTEILLTIFYRDIFAIEDTPYEQLNSVCGFIGFIPFGWQWLKNDHYLTIGYRKDGATQVAVFKMKQQEKALQAVINTVDAYHRRRHPSLFVDRRTPRQLNGLDP
jgi:hypothetical protein